MQASDDEGQFSLGALLRSRRKTLGLTQAEAAKTLEISPSYLNLIENGHRPLGAGLAQRLARLLQIEPALLLGAPQSLWQERLGAEALGGDLEAKIALWPEAAARIWQLKRALAALEAQAGAGAQDLLLEAGVHQILEQAAALQVMLGLLRESDLSEGLRRRFMENMAQDIAKIGLTARKLLVPQGPPARLRSSRAYAPFVQRAEEDPAISYVHVDQGGHVLSALWAKDLAVEAPLCPLWPIFDALRHPQTPLQGRLRLWGEGRVFAFEARGIWVGETSVEAHLLLRPADPLLPDRAVGLGCALCPAANCAARRE